MNQTFHTSAEPSPESSEPAASFNPLPPWDDHIPSTFTPSSHWNSQYAIFPKPEEDPYFPQYSHPVETPSQNVNEEWPQKTHVRMIEPCIDYKQHAAWLQHNFPQVKTSTRSYLVSLVLKIKTSADVGRCLSMPPDEWYAKLGGYMYKMYVETIVELVCIWHFCICLEDPVPYDLYLEHALEWLPSLEEVFKTLIKHKEGSNWV